MPVTNVHCKKCDADVTLVPVDRMWSRGECLDQACPNCRTRYTHDGVTFTWVSELPKPTLPADSAPAA